MVDLILELLRKEVIKANYSIPFEKRRYETVIYFPMLDHIHAISHIPLISHI